MKVLVDCDVLIDLALDREPFSQAAAQLLERLEQSPGVAYVAWHSIANFYYLVRPGAGGADAKRFIGELMHFAKVAPTNSNSVVAALSYDMADFEDALQASAAIACGTDVIATRNTKDYRKSPVKAARPLEVIKLLNSSHT